MNLRDSETERVRQVQASRAFSDVPLDFLELTRFNSWFALHPEKVAGKEVVSTSREFPITIKGTKEDILRVTGDGGQIKFQLALKMKRAKASDSFEATSTKLTKYFCLITRRKTQA